MVEKKFNVLYNGRKIYLNMTHEECSDILHELSEKYFSGENIDPKLIELEEI